MQLEVRVFAGLEKYVSGARFGEPLYLDFPEGTTGRDLIQKLNIPEEQIFSILINGVQKKLDDVLQDADRISLFPPVGGG
ncbi:MoaD/ThiS family protein [Desulfolucanica intricata]|uniref:MoaD/ThiS family protein n=1 Tax=Desulfolucanica intricata TaxID=1285191 RepID=UPI0008374AAB|nr:MoaD/ThiS family protein [Desulfolucanica intricata]